MSSYDGWAEIYDMVYGNFKEDLTLYLEYAKQRGSPILEIACGTGRVLIPLAEAGYEVWGIDISPAMLAKAQGKISKLPENVRKRIHLVQADMRDFNLDMCFPLVLIPAWSFLNLLTVEDQVRTLEHVRGHLKDGGTLIIDLFAPRFDFLAQDRRQVIDKINNPENNHVIFRTEIDRYDHANQLMDVDYLFEEHGEDGNPIRNFHLSLKLRYIFRYEMEHLLKLSGFDLEAVYGTFDRKPYNYISGEMIFIASIA
jgi:SAM-dependent methyltransferase